MNAVEIEHPDLLIERVTLSPGLLAYSNGFDQLPLDPYCRGRQRRFSQYQLKQENGDLVYELLPHRPHIQARKYNKETGGILRNYASIEMDVAPLLDFVGEVFGLDRTKEWHVDLHQWRMNCVANTVTDCVPEGLHQDGHQLVGIFVVKRHNISGGVTSVYDTTGNILFSEPLKSGEGVLLDDSRCFHHTTGISADEETGFRDIFVVCINEWASRKYGEAFEIASQGS